MQQSNKIQKHIFQFLKNILKISTTDAVGDFIKFDEEIQDAKKKKNNNINKRKANTNINKKQNSVTKYILISKKLICL